MALFAMAAFALGLVLDVVDTEHKVAIERRDAHAAARMSVTMYLLGIVGAWAAIDVSMWLALPTCAGLYAGSWAAVRRHA